MVYVALHTKLSLSYLEDRKQFVHVNNYNSETLNVYCGVPQGSHLGPTLFSMYIYDICTVSQIFKFILFADDTNKLYSVVIVT